MSECEHRMVELAAGTRCNLCGMPKTEWELMQKVAALEGQVALLLAACEMVMEYSDDFHDRGCPCEVCVAVRTAIAAAKGATNA